MATVTEPQKRLPPIIRITLVNYEQSRKNDYAKNFMLPLIKGLLERKQRPATSIEEHLPRSRKCDE